jgi:imidazolonepropionase
VRHTRAATKKELKRSAVRYLTDMMRYGTTTVEIKSGYGLSLDDEVKMLEAINELRDEEMMTIVPTFLGAHAVPPEYTGRRPEYVKLIVETMLPYVGKKKLASFCDVFCEKGYFEPDESEKILREGMRWGMAVKIHAEELTAFGGAELAGRLGAVSADHLECISEKGITALRDSGVIATLLPGVSFNLKSAYAPARRMIDQNLAVAIASDFNPGSCMSYSMPMMMTIACTQMKMTPEEALSSATLNGAAALGLSSTHGSVEAGKAADLLIADVPDYRFLAYHYGSNHIRRTVKNGTLLEF